MINQEIAKTAVNVTFRWFKQYFLKLNYLKNRLHNLSRLDWFAKYK